jgi:transcriptional regulator with XRE-family HTH domain
VQKIDTQFAQEIAQWRELCGLTQAEAAKLFGCSRGTINQWERGGNPIPVKKRGRLLNLYKKYNPDLRIPQPSLKQDSTSTPLKTPAPPIAENNLQKAQNTVRGRKLQDLLYGMGFTDVTGDFNTDMRYIKDLPREDREDFLKTIWNPWATSRHFHQAVQEELRKQSGAE